MRLFLAYPSGLSYSTVDARIQTSIWMHTDKDTNTLSKKRNQRDGERGRVRVGGHSHKHLGGAHVSLSVDRVI